MIRSRAEKHQNDKNTKVQQETKVGFGILGRDTCTFYACTFAAKAQKYKINSGKDGPLVYLLLIFCYLYKKIATNYTKIFLFSKIFLYTVDSAC